MDARCKLIDLAAYLDRMDRHAGEDDERDLALRGALGILMQERPDRAKAVLDALSDDTADILESAPYQGAFGAPRRREQGGGA